MMKTVLVLIVWELSGAIAFRLWWRMWFCPLQTIGDYCNAVFTFVVVCLLGPIALAGFLVDRYGAKHPRQ